MSEGKSIVIEGGMCEPSRDMASEGEIPRNEPRDEVDMKQMTIRAAILNPNGSIEGCTGCEAATKGRTPYQHSELCRGTLRDRL